MGAGLRDAANLTWKLAGVLNGTLPESALDTYQTERKPHAQVMIRMAKLIGRAMTEGGDVGKVLRHVLAPRLHLVPGLKDRVLSSETPALHRSSLVLHGRLRRGLAGRLCPNAVVADGRHFDDVAADRFAVITSTPPYLPQRTTLEARGAVVIQTHPGEPLHDWLRRGHATTAVVRPDGTVLYAGRDLTKACAAVPPTDRGRP